MKKRYLFLMILVATLCSCGSPVEKKQTAKEFFDEYYQKNEQAFLKGIMMGNLQIDSAKAKLLFKHTMDYYFSLDSNFTHLNGKELTEFVKKHEDGVLEYLKKVEPTLQTDITTLVK